LTVHATRSAGDTEADETTGWYKFLGGLVGAYGAATRNDEVHAAPAPADLDGDLASLRADCARTASRRAAAAPGPDVDAGTGLGAGSGGPAAAADIHGVPVPASSARLLDSMSEYGD
jgi:hypothetical protein